MNDVGLRAIMPVLLYCVFTSASQAQESPQPATAGVAAPAPVSPPARIRIFGQNGAGAVLFADSTCVGSIFSGKGEKVSGGMGSAFSSFFGTVENKPLGIPETETTRNLSKKDGLASKAYFNEYEIPPEKPTSLRLSFKDVSSFYVFNGVRYSHESASCSGAITFTPRAGEDYEAGFAMNDHACSLSINQVLVKDGKTEMVPVNITEAPDC